MNDSNLYAPFKIIVYGYHNAQLEAFAGIEAKEVNGASKSRWSYFSEYQNCWVLFIDKDCSLSEKTLELLKEKIIKFNKNTVFSGHYESSLKAPAYVIAYNLICNQWRNLGHKYEDPRLLGGCFLIFCSEKFSSEYFQSHFSNIPKWGAEDFQFSRILQKLGHSIVPLNFLFVMHRPIFGVHKFFRRAFLHGFNRPVSSTSNRKSISDWFSSVKSVGLLPKLFIFLHLTTVGIGVIASKFRLRLPPPFQNNKPQEQKY